MLIERLRAETRADHERIEAATDLLAPNLTPERYIHFLERMFGYLEPLEARLAAAPGWSETGIEPRARARAHLVVADLAALGHDRARIDGLPRCEALPDVSIPARALGGLYVLEGSRLGGRVLTRALGPRFGLDPTRGLSFLSGGPVDSAPSWPRLLEALESWAATHPECQDELVRAARETYATLTAWQLGARGVPE